MSDDTRERYDPAAIEPKWQQVWDEQSTFRAERHPGKKKLYVLDMFPYPSGSGLHVGHPEGYTATDIVARYWRMRGVDVLHPMGWDAFGLPAEQHAIATNTHPRDTTAKNIATFKRQLKSSGSATTGRARSTRPTPATSAGRSGSSSSSSRRASPTRRRSPSTGARRSAPCSPTKRSSTARASGEGTPSSASRSGSGCSRSRRTPIASTPTSRVSTGPSDEDQAAPVDWPQRRREIDFDVVGSGAIDPRLHDAGRHAARRDLRRARARASARRRRSSRPSTREAVRAYVEAARSKSDLDRAEAKTKTGVPLGATAREPDHGREGPHLGRRLRHRDVRHGRGHGRPRARRARSRVRARVRRCRSCR